MFRSNARKLQLLTKEHYDRYCFDYDTSDRKERKLRHALLGKLIREGLDETSRSILDIGGGVGSVAAWVAEQCHKQPVVIDLSFKSLQKARQKGLKSPSTHYLGFCAFLASQAANVPVRIRGSILNVT